MKHLYTVIFLCLISLNAFNQKNNITFPISYSSAFYPLEKEFIITYNESREYFSNSKVFEKYDAQFNLISTSKVQLDVKKLHSSPTALFKSETDLYFLYTYYQTSKFQIIKYNLETGNIESAPAGKHSSLGGDLKLIIQNDKAYISFHDGSMKYKPGMIIYDLKSGEVKNIELKYNQTKIQQIYDMTFDEDKKELNILFIPSIKKGDKIEMLKFDENGNKLNTTLLNEPEAHLKPTVNIFYSTDKSFFASGTVDDISENVNQVKSKTKTTFYISKYNEDKLQWINYYNIMEFESSKDYSAELKEIMDKNKSKQKTKYQFHFHKPIITENEILIIAEIFFPTHKYVTNYHANGDSKTSKVFIGYQYSHAVLMLFDKNTGEKKWDNSFPLNIPFKPMYINNQVSVETTQEGFLLMNSSSRGIAKHSLSVNGNLKTLESKKTNQSSKEFSFNDSSEEGEVIVFEKWFDNYYLRVLEKKATKVYDVRKIKIE